MGRLHRTSWAAAVFATLAIVVGVRARLFGPARLRFTYLTGSLDPAKYAALTGRPGWSESVIAARADVKLMGLVRRPRSSEAPWLLFFPGNDALQLTRGQEFLARVARDEDWGLATYAYRGYESSGGVPLLSDLAADAGEVLRQLCEREHVAPARVHVVGFSIGGHLAVRAVDSAVGRGQRPASLSLLAPVDDIVMVRRSFWQRLDPGDDYQTRPFLQKIPAPVLVLQGSADEALHGPGQAQAIAGALGSRARYQELPGVGHNVLLETAVAIDAVHTFIAEQSRH